MSECVWAYVFRHEVSGESRDVGGHFVDSKSDGVHGAFPFWLLAARLVVLRYRHDDVALGAGRTRDLHEELRIHGRRLCVDRSNSQYTPSVVNAFMLSRNDTEEYVRNRSTIG